MTYQPTISSEEAVRMQAWHDEHYEHLKKVSEGMGKDGHPVEYRTYRIQVADLAIPGSVAGP